MKEALIGEVVTLRAPSGAPLAAAVATTAEAMMEVLDADIVDRDELEQQVAAALDSLASDADVDARITVHDDGLQIHLHDTSDPESAVTLSCGA
jgi:hypothetical protein